MQVLFVICRRDLCSIIRTMFRTSQELINEKGKIDMHYYNIKAAEAARLIAARSNGYEITKDVMTALKGCFDSGHALFIQGGCGTGKTEFFEQLKKSVDPRLEIVSMMKLSRLTADELDNQLEYLRDKDVVFDDLGSELTSNNFGLRYDSMHIIVADREKLSRMTHFTTNLSDEAILKRYGDRIFDRLGMMCLWVSFAGGSRRKTRVFENPYKREVAI